MRRSKKRHAAYVAAVEQAAKDEINLLIHTMRDNFFVGKDAVQRVFMLMQTDNVQICTTKEGVATLVRNIQVRLRTEIPVAKKIEIEITPVPPSANWARMSITVFFV